MRKFDPDHYLPIDAYSSAVDTLHVLSGMLLLEFARQVSGMRTP